MSLITVFTWPMACDSVPLSVALTDGFFCLTCSRFDAAGAIEIGVTSFQLLVSSLTHALHSVPK